MNDVDTDCFCDDTTAPPATDANDGASDEAGGDDTPAAMRQAGMTRPRSTLATMPPPRSGWQKACQGWP